MEQIKYPTYPTAQQDFRDVALNVAGAWILNPAITLLWTNSADFNTKAGLYASLVASRLTIGASRQPESEELANLDETMDERLPDLKGYCIGKWGMNNAPSHYASFGIVHRNDSYIWPTDRNERKTSLQMCAPACVAAGFTGLPFVYDSAFWDNIRIQYELLMTNTTTIDGQVADIIGARDLTRTFLVSVMDALLLSLRANYPDTFQNVWRTWGWQAEDF